VKNAFVSFVLLACALSFAEPLGKVSYFVGTVKVKGGDAKEWKEARLNQVVANGDQVKTEKSDRVEITLKDGSLIRVSEQSEVVLALQGGKTVSPELKKGKIWANIKKLGQRNFDFEVTSATATAAIRGTVFRMDELDSSTVVSVYDGKVAVGPGVSLKKQYGAKTDASLERKEVSGPVEVPGPYEVSLMDWVTIAKGQRISVLRNGKYAQTNINMKNEADDEWVKFNMQRDSVSGIKH
jgi:hypothetical protein